MSGFGDFFMGKKAQTKQIPILTQQQQGAMNQLLGQSMGGLGGNKFDFAPIEQQARQGFAQQTIPGIAERFSRMGSGGSQRSSAFAGALGQAGAGLEGSLASMKQNYGLEQQNQLMRMLQMALQPQFENLHNPSSQGFLGSMLGPMGQGIGQGMGMHMGQGMGQGMSSMLPFLMGL